MFAPATKGGRPLHVRRGPNCTFMTEIACMKEGSLGSEPFGGGVEARRQGSGQGYDYPTKVVTRERDGQPHRLQTSVPLPRPNIAGGHMLGLIVDGSL